MPIPTPVLVAAAVLPPLPESPAEPPPAPLVRLPFWDRWYGLPISLTPHYRRWTAVATLIALNLAGYIWTWAWGIVHYGIHAPASSFFSEQMLGCGAQFGPFIQNGQYWRLLAPAFLHYGTGHLCSNLFLLWLFGRPLEFLCGRANTLAVYLLAAVGCELLSAAVQPVAIGAGASGAVIGLGSALLVICFSSNLDLPGWRLRGLMYWSLIFFAIELRSNLLQIFKPVTKGVDIYGHLGGWLSGAIIGAWLLWSLRLPREEREVRQRRVLLLMALQMTALMAMLVQSNRLIPQGYSALIDELQKSETEIEQARREVLRNPKDAQAHLELGKILEKRWQASSGEPEFRHAVELRPGFHEAECALARSVAGSDAKESMTLFRKCLPYEDFGISNFSNFGHFAIAVHRFGSKPAEESARQDVAAHPSEWEAHFWLAQILYQNNQRQEALREQKVAEALKQGPLPFTIR
jgi:rhomboid protease GluP